MNVVNDSGFRAGWFVGRVGKPALTATLVLKGTFRMKPGAVADPLPEPDQLELTGDVHLDEDMAKSIVQPTDFALFKPHADVLLKGTCYPAGRHPVAASRVTFAVGPWSKSLAVIGDREWKGRIVGGTSEPAPFDRMPLSYERAFGGSGSPENTAGRGAADETMPDGSRVRRLPNVEFTDRLISDPDKKHPPAGFGPLPMTSPVRMAKVGRYDKKWLKENWPWFPDDFDWSFFNSAPLDQQFSAYLNGSEVIRLENMHPVESIYECRLPGLRPRWFTRVLNGGGPRFSEVPLNLDTLFVDADLELVTLVWRGVTEIQSKKMKEFEDLYIVVEPGSSSPASLGFHEEELARRQAEPAPELKEDEDKEKPPGKIAPPSTKWADQVEADEKAMADESAAMLQTVLGRQKDIVAEMKRQGVVLKDFTIALPGPDAFTFKRAKEDRLKAISVDPALAAQLPEIEEKDLKFDEPEAPEDASIEDDEPWTPERCVSHAAGGGHFDGQDLTGLDLSRLDFHGVSFEGAVLAGCLLSGASLAGASFIKASFAGADLSGADLRGADLTGADVSKAVMAGANLSEATIEGADFSEAGMKSAILDSARGRRPVFFKSDLTGASFRKADLPSADFDECLGAGADFSNARLEAASFQKIDGAGIKMTAATILRARFSGARMTGAHLGEVQGPESVWEEAVLDGSDLSGSHLERANFDGASLVACNLSMSNLKKARLPEAILSRARLHRVNLFRGSLEGADLTGADLRSSNLYEVEFYQAVLTDTLMTGANIKGTKLA